MDIGEEYRRCSGCGDGEQATHITQNARDVQGMGMHAIPAMQGIQGMQ